LAAELVSQGDLVRMVLGVKPQFRFRPTHFWLDLPDDLVGAFRIRFSPLASQ
jgi:hypothetical protein